MFQRGYYSIEDGHANSIPMIALLAEGGTTFFGLYMLIYETTLNSEGMISEKNVYLLGKDKAKLDKENIKQFIDICLEQGLFEEYQEPTENKNNPVFYRVIESANYLWWFREQKDKKSRDCSEAGKRSAEVRAEAKDIQRGTAQDMQAMYKAYQTS